MTLAQTVGLGALAGFTIYLGLPVARLRQKTTNFQSLLTALALGILLFLVWDILSKALGRVEEALKEGVSSGRLELFAVLVTMLVLGLVVGLVGLVIFDMRTMRQNTAGRLPGQTALMIAVGLGLHNFSEGLAIGQGAVQGAVAFTLVLGVGFSLHNITEGFAVAAPLSVSGEGPSWSFLGLLGLIGGGPTFLGTIVGYHVAMAPAFVLCLALAAGALIYVIGEMFAACRRLRAPLWSASGIALGFLIAYGTDLILSITGV
jgi:ZIP family zinc transporter